MNGNFEAPPIIFSERFPSNSDVESAEDCKIEDAGGREISLGEEEDEVSPVIRVSKISGKSSLVSDKQKLIIYILISICLVLLAVYLFRLLLH